MQVAKRLLAVMKANPRKSRAHLRTVRNASAGKRHEEDDDDDVEIVYYTRGTSVGFLVAYPMYHVR